MNQDQVKELLLKIEESTLDFTVTFTGKESKKVNGLYKPDTREILLHNKNFKSDNQLVYTAIHEYTHHLINEAKGGRMGMTRVHTNDFWARFHGLLEKAEAQNLYVIGLENAPELEALTEEIRDKYLKQNGVLMQEFGRLLLKAHELCLKAEIRYEDYIDRILRLPRAMAKSIAKVSTLDVDPSMGFENMKLVASIPGKEKQAQAQEQLLAGKSPDTVRAMMKKRADEIDQKALLEKEKIRLEKTIQTLQSRLEQVEENLSQLVISNY